MMSVRPLTPKSKRTTGGRGGRGGGGGGGGEGGGDPILHFSTTGSREHALSAMVWSLLLRNKQCELQPCASATLIFIASSSDELSSKIAQHGRVAAGDVDISACTVEGEGLKSVGARKRSHFTVRAVDTLIVNIT